MTVAAPDFSLDSVSGALIRLPGSVAFAQSAEVRREVSAV